MENESKPVGSESARQETASDTPQDALPPLPSTSRGKGRGKGRGRGKKDKSEQDSAYSSGSQAKRRGVDESHHTQQTTPTTTSGDESRPSPNPAEMLAPNSPAQQAAKAQSLATLSEALDFVDQCRKSNQWQNMEKQKSLTNMASSLMASPEPVPGTSHDMQMKLEQEQEKLNSSKDMADDNADHTRFCVAVSLNDGLVQHTTNFCSNEMGYPADMWIGRSILDFIHIEDRDLFSSFVTENIHLEMVGNEKTSFCVRIRQYNGLKSGFTVKRRKTRYNTFKVSTFFRGLPKKQGSLSPPGDTYLFITAEPIRCAYKTPLEIGPVTAQGGKNFFSTQHKADCTLSWLDESAILFTGYITQHILGHSILEFIHPSDLTILKKIFEKLVDTRGQPGHSEAVRMRTQNRSYISLNSTWSSFINPWTQKLEFVMGKHTVLLGPEDIEDFFSSSLNPSKGLSVAGQAIQEDIRKCLTKALKVPSTSTSSEARKQDLLIQSLMGTILKDSKSTSKPPGPLQAPLYTWQPPMAPITIPGMLFSDSDSAPNYTQLNYKENITRYFNSQPRTHTETKTKEDFFPEVNIPSSDPSKTESPKRRKVRGGKRRSGSGGSKSSDSASGSGSKPMSPTLDLTAGQAKMDTGQEEENIKQTSSNPRPITVELMAQHNEDMEKEMKEKFKVSKMTSDQRFILHKAPSPIVATTVRTPSVAMMAMPIPEALMPPLMEESSKDMSPPRATNRVNVPQELMVEAESDSSDLYSFLHSTSDMMTLPSSSEGPRKIMKVARRWRPSRQEPFWNQKVHHTRELVNQYELPTLDLGQVLKRDNLRLMMMSQPSEVKCQLSQLIEDISMEGLNLDEFMEDLQCSASNSSSDNDDHDISDSEESAAKKRRLVWKKNYRETMSIFLEEDAPFPDPSPEALAKGVDLWPAQADAAFDMGWDTSTSSTST